MALRILVSVKRVVDYAVKIRVKPDKSGVVTDGVKHSMNPFCEIALEEAVCMKEKKHASDILAVSCGPPSSQEVLRHALALGADRAMHVQMDQSEYDILEPLHVAKILKAVAIEENCNFLILGKQAIDDDCNQTGQMLSALLNWPQALFASKVEMETDGWVKVHREIDGGSEIIKCKPPMILTTDLRLNVPRYATLPNIMKSKKKPIVKKTMSDLGVHLKAHQRIVQVCDPPKREAGEIVASVDELISKLRAEGHLTK